MAKQDHDKNSDVNYFYLLSKEGYHYIIDNNGNHLKIDDILLKFIEDKGLLTK
jgi:hypothetical protein